MSMFPTATLRHMTFFIRNLIVDLTSSIFSCISSDPERRVGNFPALVNPGPIRRGICLIMLSEDRKKSYFLASFSTSFLFLFSFFKSSTLMWSHPIRSACSQCAAFKIRTGNRGKTKRSIETLVTLSVVIFERNLNLNCLSEVTFLSFQCFTHFGDFLTRRKCKDVCDTPC